MLVDQTFSQIEQSASLEHTWWESKKLFHCSYGSLCVHKQDINCKQQSYAQNALQLMVRPLVDQNADLLQFLLWPTQWSIGW